MRLFEIHITGKKKSIIKEFKTLGLKTLSIILLDKENKVVGNEYMCAIQSKFETYEKCLEYTLQLVSELKSEVVRVKIESPLCMEYVYKAVYAEAHFVSETFKGFPTVYNTGSNKFVSTERVYKKEEFLDLHEKYKNVNYSEFELCLFDSNPKFDDYWLSFYKN